MRPRHRSPGRTRPPQAFSFPAAAELRRRGADRLVLVGFSMGGTAAVEAAAEITPPVAGVISLSGPEEYQGADAPPPPPS